MRIRSKKKLITQIFKRQPFQQSILIVVTTYIQKALNQIYKNKDKDKNHLKKPIQQLQSAQKDLFLMDQKAFFYYKLKLIILNAKIILIRKQAHFQQAQKLIKQCQNIQINHKNINYAQKAITILNKYFIIFEKKQLQKHKLKVQQNKQKQDQKDNYIKIQLSTPQQFLLKSDKEVQEINLLNQVFELLTKKNSLKQDQIKSIPKYNQLLIIFLYHLVNQFAKINHKYEQSRKLYKKIYSFSVRILGQSHRLSISIYKTIENFTKQFNNNSYLYPNLNHNNNINKSRDFNFKSKSKKRLNKIHSQLRSKTIQAQQFHKQTQQNNIVINLQKLKKNKLKRIKNLSVNKVRQIQMSYAVDHSYIYSKIYSIEPFQIKAKKSNRVSTEISNYKDRYKMQDSICEMKDLEKIKNLYDPLKKNFNQRRSIREIILQTRASFDKISYSSNCNALDP